MSNKSRTSLLPESEWSLLWAGILGVKVSHWRGHGWAGGRCVVVDTRAAVRCVVLGPGQLCSVHTDWRHRESESYRLQTWDGGENIFLKGY